MHGRWLLQELIQKDILVVGAFVKQLIDILWRFLLRTITHAFGQVVYNILFNLFIWVISICGLLGALSLILFDIVSAGPRVILHSIRPLPNIVSTWPLLMSSSTHHWISDIWIALPYQLFCCDIHIAGRCWSASLIIHSILLKLVLGRHKHVRSCTSYIQVLMIAKVGLLLILWSLWLCASVSGLTFAIG